MVASKSETSILNEKQLLKVLSAVKSGDFSARLTDGQFGVLITDIGMPQVNGLDLLIYAKQRANGCNTTPPPM